AALFARDGWSVVVELCLLALAGAGFGAGYSPVIARAIAQVPAGRAQDASGVLNTTVQLSFALGVATVGSYFLGALGQQSQGTADAFAGAGLLCAVSAVVALVAAGGLLLVERRSAASGVRAL